jgi:hypothetical protein
VPARKTNKKALTVPPWQAKLSEGVSWPVLGAWCSNLPSFTICGQGMMFFFRKSPRGPVAGVMAHLDFQGWGLDELGVFNAASETEIRDKLISKFCAAGHFLLRELPFDEAARLLWACAAYRDKEFEPGFLKDIAPYKDFIAPPVGTELAWLSWLTGPEGHLRLNFLKLARKAADVDLPPGKELYTATRATFQVSDTTQLLKALRKSGKEFEPLDSGKDSTGRFCWTRAYPRGHWSPLAGRGSRQVLGEVAISGDCTRAGCSSRTPWSVSVDAGRTSVCWPGCWATSLLPPSTRSAGWNSPAKSHTVRPSGTSRPSACCDTLWVACRFTCRRPRRTEGR